MAATKTAEFFSSRANGGAATIRFATISSGIRVILFELPVGNKREARKLAAENGAQCWNF